MKTKNIFFIVDDDPDDQELFIKALKEIDEFCACETAFDGQEALYRLSHEMFLSPDFIFLDLNMPRMNGKQFLAEIKKDKKLQQIPVVIYSTSAVEKDILETAQLGAVTFLQKPNKFDDLSSALSDIIAGRWK